MINICVTVDGIDQTFTNFPEARQYFRALLGKKDVRSFAQYVEPAKPGVTVGFHANSPFRRCSVTGCSAEEAIELCKTAEAQHSKECPRYSAFTADSVEARYATWVYGER